MCPDYFSLGFYLKYQFLSDCHACAVAELEYNLKPFANGHKKGSIFLKSNMQLLFGHSH